MPETPQADKMISLAQVRELYGKLKDEVLLIAETQSGTVDIRSLVRRLNHIDESLATFAVPDVGKAVREQAIAEEHANHMKFEAELYATLVDPVECSAKNEAEQHEQLLQAARWSRQHIADLEEQLNAHRATPASAEGEGK